MLSSKRLHTLAQCLRSVTQHIRFARTDAASFKRRPRAPASGFSLTKTEDKSEWWVVDGEMHEIGDHVPPRERFVIPRDNIPNKRRKQLREQFMRRTRLVIKESEHEPWCRKYMELYNELRENWERLYWDEGYSRKIAKDHAKYESAEEDDQDFNPYRNRGPRADLLKDQGFVRNRQADNFGKANQLRDKFEFDREKRMREKAFAPINGQNATSSYSMNSMNQPFDTQRYFSDSD